MEDYKDIHDNQKLQSKLNFFENSIDSTLVKKPEKSGSNNVVNSVVIDKNPRSDLQSLNSNYKSNPSDRKPRDISNNNINKINSIFEKYKGKINSQVNTIDTDIAIEGKSKHDNYISSNHIKIPNKNIGILFIYLESDKSINREKWSDKMNSIEQIYIKDRPRNQFNVVYKSTINKEQSEDSGNVDNLKISNLLGIRLFIVRCQ